MTQVEKIKSIETITERIIKENILLDQSGLISQLFASNVFDIDEVKNLWREGVEEPVEVLEWWAVTPWLASKLDQIGEPVLINDFGSWWGRTCSGQSILYDDTIQDIAKKII